MGTHCWQVSMGGLVFEVFSQKKGKWSSSFQGFLSSRSKIKEVRLDVSFGSPSQQKPSNMFFDSGTTWSLAKENGHFVLHVPSLSSKEPHEASVYFDDSFEKGKMVIHSAPENRFDHSPLEYPFGEIWMMHLLPPRKGLLIHSFGVAIKDGAYLFVGSSGQGKTTSARLWNQKKLGTILSDDRVIVRKEKGGWFVYGTPWHGEAHFSSPLKAPLKKLFFLKHSKQNELQPLSFMEALSRLMVRSFHPFWNGPLLGQSTDVAAQLVQEIPAYEFGFLPDSSAVKFIQKHL